MRTSGGNTQGNHFLLHEEDGNLVFRNDPLLLKRKSDKLQAHFAEHWHRLAPHILKPQPERDCKQSRALKRKEGRSMAQRVGDREKKRARERGRESQKTKETEGNSYTALQAPGLLVDFSHMQKLLLSKPQSLWACRANRDSCHEC